jgi:hypothetical protein
VAGMSQDAAGPAVGRRNGIEAPVHFFQAPLGLVFGRDGALRGWMEASWLPTRDAVDEGSPGRKKCDMVLPLLGPIGKAHSLGCSSGDGWGRAQPRPLSLR